MNDLIVIHRYLNGTWSMPRTVAEQIIEERYHGKIVVITKNPSNMLASVKEEWKLILEDINEEKARTSDAHRLKRLDYERVVIEQAALTATPPGYRLDADVTFATADHLVRFAPECRTLLVSCRVETESGLPSP